MTLWTIIIVVAAIAIAAPLAARAGKRYGRRARGGLMLAAAMFGLGEPIDPPSKHLIEAREGEEKASPETGEPPLP